MTMGQPTLSDMVGEGIAAEGGMEDGPTRDPSRAWEGGVTEPSPDTSKVMASLAVVCRLTG